MISIIVAIAENYAIGKQGGLLCHLPEDLKHFKTITSGWKTIYIEQILSPDLKSRMRAQDLKQLIINSEVEGVELDFRGVKFATRSFIDEFYNLFLKNPDANSFRLELTNVPEDIKAMLDAVSHTQVRAKVIPAYTPEVSFKDANEFIHFLSTFAL